MNYISASLNSVLVKDNYMLNAFNIEVNYLKSLDVDKLLSGFYKTKGLEPKAEQYPGWESSEIQGHTLGHYITAVCQAIESRYDNDLYKKVEYIIDELINCQHDSGFLSASDEGLYDKVEKKEPAWVPWYTMHKILAGVISAHKLLESVKTLNLLTNLCNWIANRVNKWSPKTQKTVLAVEYGGMNDALYEAYLITKDNEHLKAAHQFDELPLFTNLKLGNDILNNLHANTTIPKFLGAMKRVIATGDVEFYLDSAENFWETVVKHHTYITGGNSEWEHFGQPDILDKERTNCTCETCNTYNMLKLSKGLFEITGKLKYLDYYENTLNNAILPSQNPETGMTMYFQPMATGYFKVYGTPYDKFWCCTGSGMENFTKLNDGIFYTSNSEFVLARYHTSEFKWEDKGYKVEVTVDFIRSSKVKIKISSLNKLTCSVKGKLFIPSWVNGAKVVNSEVLDTKISTDFIEISGIVNNRAEVYLDFPMEIKAYNLPDGKNTYGFKYGPYVLSAELGTEAFEVSRCGVDVTIPTKNIEIDDFFVVDNIDKWLEKTKSLKVSSNLDKGIIISDNFKNYKFIPHFLQHTQRYGIYWRVLEVEGTELAEYKKAKVEKDKYEVSIIDRIPLGNDQYELEHKISGINTVADTRDGYMYRELHKDGVVSFNMEVEPNSENLLEFKYSLSDKFNFSVEINGTTLKDICNETPKYLDYKDESLVIPEALINNSQIIKVTFKNLGNNPFRIADLLLTRRNN